MKLIILFALCVTAAAAAPAPSLGHDDDDLKERIEDQIVASELIFRNIVAEVKEFEKTGKEEAKKAIIAKIDKVLEKLKACLSRIHAEAEKKDNSINKQIILQYAEMRINNLRSRLRTIEQKLKLGSVELNIIDDIKKMVVDKIVAFEKELADIAQKFLEYEKTKSPEAKEALIKKIDEELVKLKSLEDQIHAEAAKKDNNKIKQWLLEHAEALVKNIETRLKSFEDKLKGGSAELGAIDDIKKMIVDKIVAFERELIEVAQKFIEYEKTKSPEAKAALIKKIDEELAKLKSLEDEIHAEAAKKDNNQIKQWLLEHAETLVKNIEAKIKAIEEKLKGSVELRKNE